MVGAGWVVGETEHREVGRAHVRQSWTLGGRGLGAWESLRRSQAGATWRPAWRRRKEVCSCRKGLD